MIKPNKKQLLFIGFSILTGIIIYSIYKKNKKFDGVIDENGELNLQTSETVEPVQNDSSNMMTRKFNPDSLPENLKPPIRIEGEINPLSNARPKNFGSLNGISFMPRFDV